MSSEARGKRTAFLHYSAPPVVGGVEMVMLAHARSLIAAGFPLTMIAGRGDPQSILPGIGWKQIPLLDSQHPEILEANRALEAGRIPPGFETLKKRIIDQLESTVKNIDHLVVHNVFTKHFNLALTAALFYLLDTGAIRHCIAWCHDLTWTSPHSRSKVHPGYPWELLKTYRPDIDYVAISDLRRKELAGVLGCTPDRIRVIYNGVEAGPLLGLSNAGLSLADRLGLWNSSLILLMPVRITQAKNIELAIRIAAALKPGFPGLRLVVSGPPDPHERDSQDYFEHLKQLRRQLGVEEEVVFIYEAGPTPGQPYEIGLQQVGELYRLSDALLMPSHREGFGMPVLEAGLTGMPVFSTAIPAAVEIGREDVHLFSPDDNPSQVADMIKDWAKSDRQYHLRRRVREQFIWSSIFSNEIRPLISGDRGEHE